MKIWDSVYTSCPNMSWLFIFSTLNEISDEFTLEELLENTSRIDDIFEDTENLTSTAQRYWKGND